MFNTARSTLVRYGVALAALALATAARFALDPALGGHLPYVTYFVAIIAAGRHAGSGSRPAARRRTPLPHFVAIMAVARYGGLGPSLATLALGSLAATYFFVPPRGGLVPHRMPAAGGSRLPLLLAPASGPPGG